MSESGSGVVGGGTTATLFVGADGRTRWFWRLVVFGALVIAATMVLTFVAYPLVASATSAAGFRFIAFPWISIGGLLIAHAATLAWVERHRPWSFVRLGRGSLGPRRLALGALIGALAIGIPVAVMAAFGWMRKEPAPPGSSAAVALQFALILLPFALSEELTFRGYPFAVLEERFGARAAIVATSVVFGLFHLGNPGATVEAITLVIVAGVLLAAVMLATESLYAAWAAHFAWNWTMAALMHVPVSGSDLAIKLTDYQLVETGPDWATGGAWGPEGGVGALLGMAAGLYFLWTRPRMQALLARRAARTAGDAELLTNIDARPTSREES